MKLWMQGMLAIALCCLSANAAEKECFFTVADNVLFKQPVPEKGITTSNYGRAMRLAQMLENREVIRTPWGPVLVIGDYQGEKFFVASAPVGTGSGLVFTELFICGAKYIIRYGSEDGKAPPASNTHLVKIIDEADNLYGFNIQSGVSEEEWGKSVQASPLLVAALEQEARLKNIAYEMRICHHLENYHALRVPSHLSEDRQQRIQHMLDELESNPKSSSYDMETAVLFRVAQDFACHAASILQTVNKEEILGPYESENLKKALAVENEIFFSYVFDALKNL